MRLPASVEVLRAADHQKLPGADLPCGNVPNARARSALRGASSWRDVLLPPSAVRFTISTMSIRLLVTCFVSLVLLSCAGTRDQRVNPDAPDTVTGTGLQSQDIGTMANQMAADIKSYGVLAPSRDGERASFFITELRNDSSDVIDRQLILRELRTELFRAFNRQVRILDRSPEANDVSEAERRMKERGQVSGTNDRKVAGSDFVLKGVIASRDRQAGKLRSSYINVTFELTDLVTQELVWTNSYKMKTESEKSVINR
jgi:hypothetical protein